MIYFDNASSTRPIDKCLDAFLIAAKESYYNPSSIHAPGMKLFNDINRIKENFLKKLKLDNNYEVIFTSGASESNNLALVGYALKNKGRGRKLITTKIEHESVLEVFKYLETQGFQVTYLNINSEGKIDIDEFKKAIDNQTILVSIMGVNNELGNVLNIKEIKEVIKDYSKCVLHSDLAQTLGKEKFDYTLPDMFTISAHKIYGLKGIGALVKKKKIMLTPLIHGGGQENGLRSGTYDYPSIVSFNASLNFIIEHFDEFYKKSKEMQAFLIENLQKIDEVVINNYPNNSSPFIVNFSLKTKKASVVVEALSNKEIYVSSVSACNSKKEGASYVLLAANKSMHEASNSIRLSLGKDNTIEECKIFIEVLKNILRTVRG